MKPYISISLGKHNVDGIKDFHDFVRKEFGFSTTTDLMFPTVSRSQNTTMKIILTNLLKYIKVYRSFFAVNILLTLLNSVLQVSIPLYFKFYVDKISTGSTMATIIVALSVFMVMIAISDFISVVWHYMLTKLGCKILFDLRFNVMKQLAECPFEDVTAIGREKLKHILFNDTLDIFRSMANFTSNLFAKGFILFLIFAVLFVLDVKIGLILLTAFIVGLWVANYSRRRIKTTASLVNKEFKKVSSFFDIYVESLRSVRANMNFGDYQNIHESHNSSFIEHALSNDKVQVILLAPARNSPVFAGLITPLCAG